MIKLSPCATCKHLRTRLNTPIPLCAAFPDKAGIPDEIGLGDNPHFRPYPGDNGITYEPREDIIAKDMVHPGYYQSQR